jgi:hypothetical protein
MDMGTNTTSGDDQDGMKMLCKQLFRKEIINPPGIFVRGEEASYHLQKIKEFIDLAEITSEQDKVSVLFNTLDLNLQKEIKMSSGFKKDDFKSTLDIFHKLCKTKVAPITPYVKFFELKQAQHQHLEDFVREIRIRAHDTIFEFSETDRESMMVKCLIKGLRKKSLSSALEILSPSTLDEAFKLIKKEDDKAQPALSEEVDVVHCSGTCKAKLDQLEKQLDKLEQKVHALESRTTNLPTRSYRDVVRSRPQIRQTYMFRRNDDRFGLRNSNNADRVTKVKCFNCQNTGHISKNCPKPQRCYNCGKIGHISRFCRSTANRRQTVNYLEETDDRSVRSNVQFRKKTSFDGSSTSEPQDLVVSNRFNGLEDEGNVAVIDADELGEEIYMVNQNGQPSGRKEKRRVSRISADFEDSYIDRQVAYIEGKGKSPNSQRTRNVDQKNKPIVKTRLNGHRVLALMDSGASCNLLDRRMMQSLGVEQNKILPTQCSIACANSSAMSPIGEVILKFDLAGVTVPMKFIVVNTLHSVDCIVGLRAMKKLGLKFNFSQDQIILNNIVVPFETVVNPSTSIPDLGNV